MILPEDRDGILSGIRPGTWQRELHRELYALMCCNPWTRPEWVLLNIMIMADKNNMVMLVVVVVVVVVFAVVRMLFFQDEF